MGGPGRVSTLPFIQSVIVPWALHMSTMALSDRRLPKNLRLGNSVFVCSHCGGQRVLCNRQSGGGGQGYYSSVVLQAATEHWRELVTGERELKRQEAAMKKMSKHWIRLVLILYENFSFESLQTKAKISICLWWLVFLYNICMLLYKNTNTVMCWCCWCYTADFQVELKIAPPKLKQNKI